MNKISILLFFLLLSSPLFVASQECSTSQDCEDGNPCTSNVCQKGHCILLYETNGTSCDDGIYCNGVDTCNGKGQCVHSGDPCPSASNVSPCNNICNEEKKNCLNPKGGTCYSKGQCTRGVCSGEGECLIENTEGHPCFVNSCIFDSFCAGNQCLGVHNCSCSTSSDCDDGNPCTIDFCDVKTKVCSHIEAKDGSQCNDGLFCNGEDTCLSGKCVKHSGNPCKVGEICSELNSQCFPIFSTIVFPSQNNEMENKHIQNAEEGEVSLSGSPNSTVENNNEEAESNSIVDQSQLRIIIGPIVGGIVLFGLIGLVVFLVHKVRRNRMEKQLPKDPRFDDYDSSTNSEKDHDRPTTSISTPKITKKSLSKIPTGFLPTRNENFVSESPKLPPPSFLSSPTMEDSPSPSPLIIRRPSIPVQPLSRRPSNSSSSSSKEKKTNTETEIENVEIQKVLGSGSFGDVYLAIWHQVNPTTKEKVDVEMAVKKLRNAENYAAFQREAETLKSLNHPHIVHYYGIFMDETNIYMATEFLPNGSVLDVLQIMKSKFLSEEHILEMALGAARGMEYLEGLKIVHRDLSCRNLLVDFDMEGKYIVKVSDFGMSKLVADSTYFIASDDFVPVRWSAPEVLENKKFSSKSDVWSFGVCMWEMFESGREPYTHLSNKLVVDSVLSGDRLGRPRSCPTDIYHIMNRCWTQHPSKRPSFKEVVVYLDFLMTNRQNMNAVRSPKVSMDRYGVASSESEREPKSHSMSSILSVPVDEETETEEQTKVTEKVEKEQSGAEGDFEEPSLEEEKDNPTPRSDERD